MKKAKFSLLALALATGITGALAQIIQFSGAGGTGGGGGVPVVAPNQSFNIHAPANSGDQVGFLTASNIALAETPTPSREIA